MLDKRDKYFCEVCQCHQEAFRQNKIKQLPQILICHLMRFDERMRKLMYRVVFPMELKLCNTTDDAPSCDDVYNLFAVVVHSGSSLNHGAILSEQNMNPISLFLGHYVSLIKSHGHWLLFDDDHVEPIPDYRVECTFGTPTQFSKVTDRGYILFYEKSPTREIHVQPKAVSTKLSESVSAENEEVRTVTRLPNKTAGMSDTGSRSNLPGFESGSRDSDTSIHRGTGETTDIGIGDNSKKPNRVGGGFAATIKSFWGTPSGRTSVESDIPSHSNHDRHLDEVHVTTSHKTNPIESRGL